MDGWSHVLQITQRCRWPVFFGVLQFCSFVREMSMRYNDPSFLKQPNAVGCPTSAASDASKYSTYSHRQSQTQMVSAKKTLINPSGDKAASPIHKDTNHTLTDCRTFRKLSLWDRKRVLKQAHMCFKCCD